MKISNSISFGAILNKVGIDAAQTAKITAAMYDRINNNNNAKKTLTNSLKTIRKYRADEHINIVYEDLYGYDDESAMHSRYHKAISPLDKKVIYEDFGDEYEFFRNFADAIKKNKLHPRNLTPKEIEEALKITFKPSKKFEFICSTFNTEVGGL